MLRRFINRNSIRLYHESRKHRERMPAVKLANSRVGYARAARRTSEAPVRVDSADPHQMHEPYPFKVTEENALEVLKNKLMPLRDIPHEEQLASKESHCRNALRSIGQELYSSGTPVRLDVKRLPCHVNRIVASPQLNHYRNRDELSIWRGIDGQTVTAGHMVFSIGKHGDTICVEPDGLDTMRPESLQLVKVVNEFLRTQAKLQVCFSLGTEGGWRRFMLRNNLDGQLMLVGVLNPRTLRVREILEERDNFRDFVVRRCQELGLKLASLYYQPCAHNHCRHRDVPYELLYGEKFLFETIGQHKFQVSPESHLYESSLGAEVLFEALRDTMKECFMNDDERTRTPIILNARCGAGLVALNLADLAEQVIGVDSSPQSVDDANSNAKLNGLTNVQFVNAEVEIVIERIIGKYSRSTNDMIVVCDTPSSGLHRNIVQVLRRNQAVNKLILIINRIDSTRVKDNILDLCLNIKGLSLPPFAPILATPVDTCPQIESFQTILALERLPA